MIFLILRHMTHE